MKSERLLSLEAEIDPGGTIQHQHQPRQQESADQAVALGVVDLEHDAVYFGAESSPRSFSGHLSEGLQDYEVLEYIRRNNRSLYNRLWDAPQEQPSQLVTPAATEQLQVSDGVHDILPPTHVTNKLDSGTEAASGALKKSLARPTSNTLLASPDPISNLPTCCEDNSPAPCGSDVIRPPPSTIPRGKNELQQDLLLLQQRRYIQSLLLNDHVFVLQKMPPTEAKMRSRSCDHPLCIHRYGIPPGFYRLSLESKKALAKATATTDRYYSPKKEDSGKYLKARSTNSRGFYCLTCVEDLFSGVGMLDDVYAASAVAQQGSMSLDDPTSTIMSVDGSSDGDHELRTLIVKAAEKLMPRAALAKDARARHQAKVGREIASADMFGGFGRQVAVDSREPTSPALGASGLDELHAMVPTPFPSNSDGAVLLRHAKGQEIDETLRFLHQAAERQEVRHSSPSSSDSDLPGLRLSRPPHVGRLRERYNKQGLGENDGRLYRRSLLVTPLRDENKSSMRKSTNQADTEQFVAPIERFCYCRELDDLEGMMHCTAEFCLIGWVHLKCSGLPRLPTKDETWFCKESSMLFGPGTFDPNLRLEDEDDVERTRVLRSKVRASSKLVDRVELDNETSDGLSTDDTSFTLSDNEIGDPTYTGPVTPPRRSQNVVGMTVTPYEFLDGAGDGKQNARSPAAGNEATTFNTGIPVSPRSIQEEPNTAKSSITPTKKTSKLSSQDPTGPRTPTKRLRRASSPPLSITPPSRHIRASFGHLAYFIHPETRISAAALSNPQIVALERWKSIYLYSPLTEAMQASRPEAANSPSTKDKSQKPSAGPSTGPNIATLEVGGAVIDLPSIHGKKLSQILAEVDNTVEQELRRHGATGWEQGVHAREEAVKIGKAKGSRIDEQNGLTSPKAANELRKRLSTSFSARKG